MNAPVSIQPVPTRARPYEKTQAKTPLWLRLILGRELAPSRAEYDAMTRDLWKGDAPMDTLIDWMYEFDPREARALFQQALDKGINNVANAPQPLRDFFETIEKEPSWLDWSLIEDGVHFIHGIGLSALYILRDLALMGGYLLSGFNQSLVKTGALNKGTSQRVAETGKWWMDCTESGGLRRFGPGYKTTLHVRLVHGLVRRNLARREEWDSNTWGLPLNQIDMVATYLGFSTVMLGGLRKFGIPITPRESQGVMHLWRYACWLMGVEERWLANGEREGMVLLHHALMTQSRADWTTRELGHALSKEPLERHFDHFQTLRRQLAYHQHLSVSQYFLGTDQMKKLGLPENVFSWYPLLSLAPRFAAYTGQRLVPALRKTLETRGRAEQKIALKQMFGDATHAVINPSVSHPGHM